MYTYVVYGTISIIDPCCLWYWVLYLFIHGLDPRNEPVCIYPSNIYYQSTSSWKNETGSEKESEEEEDFFTIAGLFEEVENREVDNNVKVQHAYSTVMFLMLKTPPPCVYHSRLSNLLAKTLIEKDQVAGREAFDDGEIWEKPPDIKLHHHPMSAGQ